MKLKLTSGNTYFGYGYDVWTFVLPSGFSCPFALDCLTYADRKTGKIRYGKGTKFKCYSAFTERYPNVRELAWNNLMSLKRKTKDEMTKLLSDAVPPEARYVRIHSGGDFFSQDYFDAWVEVVLRHPGKRFWAFTKSVGYWVNRLGKIPKGLCLQASYGGKEDHLIAEHGLKYAKVVNSRDEARALGLKVDTNDVLAMAGKESFALLENFATRGK